MLKSNLAVLMADRGLKIADVYEQTGISKTTLMSLADNKSKGVQFETTEELFKRTIDIFKEGHQSKKGKYLCAFNIGVNIKCVYREKEIQV